MPAAREGGVSGFGGVSPSPTALLTLSFQLPRSCSAGASCVFACACLPRASVTTSSNDLPSSSCFTTGRSGCASLSVFSFACSCSFAGVSPPLAASCSMVLSVTFLRVLS